MSTIMILFIFIFAHLLADYVFQNDFQATMKGKNNFILAVHCGLWTGTIATAGYLVGFSIDIIDILLLFVVHFVCDILKARNLLFYKKLDSLKSGLYVDQSFHLIQILVLMYMNM